MRVLASFFIHLKRECHAVRTVAVWTCALACLVVIIMGCASQVHAASLNVYYSVGQNVTDHKTGTPNLTISAGVGTFTAAQTAVNMGVGDAVTYNTNQVAYISGKITTSQWTLVTATGTTPADISGSPVVSIAHAFSSLKNAVGFGVANNATSTNFMNTSNLVTGGFILNIPCYFDSGPDTSAVNLIGYTTGANNYMHIYAPASTTAEVNQSQRHSGTRNASKYLLKASVAFAPAAVLYVLVDYIRIEGLQVRNTDVISTATGAAVYINPPDATSKIVISDTIAYDNYGGHPAFASANAPLLIFNNVLAASSSIGFQVTVGGTAGNAFCYNCSAVDNNTYGYDVDNFRAFTIKNSYAGNNKVAGFFKGGTSAAMATTTSASDDGTMGTNVVAYSTSAGGYFTNVTLGSENLNIGSLSSLKWSGTNLSGDANWLDPAGNVDITGASRPTGTWSIGAFESTDVQDNTAPTVDSFTLGSAAAEALTVPISAFAASDNVGVTGYQVNESSVAPTAADTHWLSATSSSYTFATAGSKTLYAWAKDAAGNVSTSRSASVTIATSTLTPSTASTTAVTASTIRLSMLPSGGATPYTYQWYRSPTAGFTPAIGTLLSGATTATITDAPPSIGPWFYKAIITDAVSNSTTTNQVAAALSSTTISLNSVSGSITSPQSILNIGDSITAGTGAGAGKDAVTEMNIALNNTLGTRNIITLNQGKGGSQTASWIPGAGTGYLTGAIAAAQAATPPATTAMIMLGANDSAQQISSSSYATNLSSIVTNLLSNGFTKVILNYPTYIDAKMSGIFEISTLLNQQYQAKIDALVNGTTILAGDKNDYNFFADYLNSGLMTADFVHPNPTGANALGVMWAQAAMRADLGLTFTPVTSFSGTTNVTSVTMAVSLANLAASGSQTVTITSDNGSDVITASSTVGTGSVTYTMPMGASFFPLTILRTTAGTSHLTITNAQGWTNPPTISFTASDVGTVPTLSTPTFSGISATGATAGSAISATGGSNATIEGFAWGTDTSYALGTTSSSGSFGATSFQNASTTLNCNTTYYVRSFATNTTGTGYSTGASFATSACGTTPTPTVTPTATPVSQSAVSSSMSRSALARILAPSAATTAYLLSLQPLFGCPSWLVCTPNPASIQPVFTHDLRFGDSGSEVRSLQVFLNGHGYVIAASGPGSPGNETDFFGYGTQAAVNRFQAAHHAEILDPQGFSAPTGVFGPASRALANSLAAANVLK